jgi:hypothetical protein
MQKPPGTSMPRGFLGREQQPGAFRASDVDRWRVAAPGVTIRYLATGCEPAGYVCPGVSLWPAAGSRRVRRALPSLG